MRSRLGGVFLPRTWSAWRPAAELRDELQRIEHEHEFSPAARQLFEQLLATLGVASSLPIGFPLDDTPYWLRDPHPLGGFRSATELPARADALIIGAGLTGASAAYHLRATRPQRAGRSSLSTRATPRARRAVATAGTSR